MFCSSNKLHYPSKILKKIVRVYSNLYLSTKYGIHVITIRVFNYLFKKMAKQTIHEKVRSQFKTRSVMTQIWYLIHCYFAEQRYFEYLHNWIIWDKKCHVKPN